MRCRVLFLAAPVIVAALACDDVSPTQTLDPGQQQVSQALGVGSHGQGAPGSIVFYSARSGANRIYMMDPDGGRQHLMSSGTGSHTWPDISPNGRFIAFTSTATGNADIYVLDLHAGTSTNVTANSGDDNWARWSPSGQQLAFHSNRDGNYNIFVMNADGSELRRITSDAAVDQWPDWSPDGKQIAFRRGQNVSVADAGAEEEGVRQLTFSFWPTINQMAVWSPNGKQLAFMSTRAGYPSVWIMGTEGESITPAVNLTPKNPADLPALWLSRAPAWSRSGQQIYFMSFRPSTSGDVELFMMRPDGAEVERLTNSTGEDGGPQGR